MCDSGRLSTVSLRRDYSAQIGLTQYIGKWPLGECSRNRSPAREVVILSADQWRIAPPGDWELLRPLIHHKIAVCISL